MKKTSDPSISFDFLDGDDDSDVLFLKRIQCASIKSDCHI